MLQYRSLILIVLLFLSSILRNIHAVLENNLLQIENEISATDTSAQPLAINQVQVYPPDHYQNRPEYQKAFFLEETLNWITFNLYGREGKGVPASSYITNAELILDLPECLDFVYEYQFYSPGSGSEPRSIKKSTITRSKEKYTRVVLDITNQLGHLVEPGHTWLIVVIRAGKFARKETTLYHHIVVNQRKSSERALPIVLLSKFKRNKVPKRYRLFTYTTQFTAFPNAEVRNELMALCEEVGIKGGGRPPYAEINSFEEDGWWKLGSCGLCYHFPVEEGNDEMWATDITGRKLPGELCPTLLGSMEGEYNGTPFIQGFFPYWRRAKLDAYVVDFELGPVGNYTTCFDDRCIRAFAKFHNISYDEALQSVEMIKQNSSSQAWWVRAGELSKAGLKELVRKWSDYKVYVHGQIAKTFRSMVKRNVGNDVKFIMYGGATGDWLQRARNQADAAGWDEYVDGHMPPIYYGPLNAFQTLDYMTKNLQKPIYPLVNFLYQPPEKLGTGIKPAELKLNVQICAAFRCQNIGLYYGQIGLNGLYLTALDEAMDEIAMLEDFYLDGKRVDDLVKLDLNQVDKDINKNLFHALAFQKGEEILIELYNFTGGRLTNSDEQAVKVRLSVSGLDSDEYLLINRLTPTHGKQAVIKATKLITGIDILLSPLSVSYLLLERLREN